jgi:hypothetical protein
MKKWISVVLGAVLVVSVVAISATAAPVSPRTLTVVAKGTHTVFVTHSGVVTSKYPGSLVPGDRIFSEGKDFIGGKAAGFDNEECTVTFNGNDLCHDVAVLTGRGEIELTYLLVGRNHSASGAKRFSGIITGGTGEFQDAHGTFRATGYGAIVTVPLG